MIAIIMEKLVTIIIVTMMTFGGVPWRKKTNLNRLKNWSGKHAQKYFLLLTSQLLNGNVKNHYGKKKS